MKTVEKRIKVCGFSRGLIALAMVLSIGMCAASAMSNDHVVSFMAGPLVGFGTRASTYSFSFSYMEGFGDGSWAWSITKLNEGHDEDHHRDGSTLQIWKRFAFMPGDRLTLAAGIGPQFWCDTVPSDKYAQGYEDDHGPGVVLSAMARWKLNDLWCLESRVNGAANSDKINTLGWLFGAGYTFEPSWTSTDSFRPGNVHLNEVTVLGGANICNSFGSETGYAYSLEYRRYLLAWLNATVGYLREYTKDVIDRQGVAPQLWWGRHFSDGHLSMGFGIGPYLATDKCRPDQPHLADESEFAVSLLASYSAAYHFDNGALLRATWHRVATAHDYNRDTDVILIGAGYAF